MEQKVDINNSNHALDILAKFDEFRQKGKHCDFIIRAGEREIAVHRFLLSASSEYFDAMFTHDTKENKEGSVEFREVDPESVVKCIDFIYTGKAAVSEEKQVELMHAAHMLRLQRLYKGIALFLEKNLNCSSFFSTREIANLYDCEKLVQVCNEFALKNFRAIAKSDDFKRLEVGYLKFLLSSSGVKENDGIKCLALMTWINYDSDRAASLFGLMKHIDFRNVPLTYRKYILENESVVTDSTECLKYVMKSFLDNTEAVQMTFNEQSIGTGIIVLDSNSWRLKSFDIQEKKWINMQLLDPKIVNVCCSVAIVKEYLYVFIANRLTFRLRYIESDATWEQMATKNDHIGDVAVLDGTVYSSDFGNFNTRLEMYDTRQNQWSFSPNKSTACFGSAIVACQGSLTLMGGNRDQRALKVVERYHPNSSSWSTAPSLNRARYRASATVLEDAIFLFGGNAESVEILHHNANSWQVVNLNGCRHQYFTSHTVDGKIYLVGNNNSTLKTIEEFDPESKNMKTVCSLTNLSLPWFSSTAAVIKLSFHSVI